MKIRICEICNNHFETNSLHKTICDDCFKKNPSLLIEKKPKENIKKENKNSSIDDIINSIFG